MTHYSTLEKNVTIHPFLPFNLFFSFSLILLYLYYPQRQCISSQQHYLAYSSWDSFIRVFHLFSTSLTSSVTFWRLSELKFLFDANSLPKSKVFIISDSVCARSAERSYERTFNKINKKISKTYYERTASNTDNTSYHEVWSNDSVTSGIFHGIQLKAMNYFFSSYIYLQVCEISHWLPWAGCKSFQCPHWSLRSSHSEFFHQQHPCKMSSWHIYHANLLSPLPLSVMRPGALESCKKRSENKSKNFSLVSWPFFWALKKPFHTTFFTPLERWLSRIPYVTLKQ